VPCGGQNLLSITGTPEDGRVRHPSVAAAIETERGG